jgi:AcrR family transcriptional regulator
VASEDPRHDILVAAARLFSERGYDRTQFNDIANAAGLRTPSLYYYFAGKAAILVELSAYSVEQSAAFATDVVQRKGPAAARLCHLLSSHFDRLTSAPYDLWFLISLTPPPDRGPKGNEVDRAYAKWKGATTRLIEDAVKEGDFREIDPAFALYMIIGCVQGALEIRHRGRKVSAADMVEFVIRALAADSATAKRILKASREAL